MDSKTREGRLKCVSKCLSILTRSLEGNYVCFEVFEMYRDQCAASAVNVLLQVCLALQPDDLNTHPKLFRRVSDFISEVLSEHPRHVLAQTPMTVNRMVNILIDGLCYDLDPLTPNNCAGGLDTLFTYLYRATTSKQQQQQQQQQQGGGRGGGVSDDFYNRQEISIGLGLAKIINDDARCRATMERIVPVLFNLVAFEKSTSKVWSLSRPLATAIACDGKSFDGFCARFVQAQPESERACLSDLLKMLTSEVRFDTSYQSKNQFTRNLCRFSQAVQTSLPRMRMVV